VLPRTALRFDQLTIDEKSTVIQMAWEDRTSFETIQEKTGLSEPEVIKLMRSELRAGSFKIWRRRMKGRVTKHRALRDPSIKFHDRILADHRMPNR
jgi:uncharacterized protein (TIGR03643 family)